MNMLVGEIEEFIEECDRGGVSIGRCRDLSAEDLDVMELHEAALVSHQVCAA